jgi:serine/threonine protein kinase
MHALGIYHADLKACNILTDKDGIRFFLTDTDRVRQYRYLSEKRRIKNLLQIHLSIPKHVSRPFRMRFLKGYTGETREDTKVLFSKIWGLSKGMEIVYTTDMGDKFERWDQESPQYPGRDEDG